MAVSLIYDDTIAGYRFSEGHPLRPERFTLAVSLMRGWGLLESSSAARAGMAPAAVWIPEICSEPDLELVHTRDYIDAVKAAGANPASADSRYGLGPGDTPAFRGMHQAGALVVGASILALEAVVDGRVQRAFSPAGGMHHAQRGRASGFCIYNDCAVAIAKVTRERPGLRVAYIDIDAHHGDGVEAAFVERADVLTASIHESGTYLFPGTGAARDSGEGAGRGYSVNVPLPPGAGAAEYALAFDQVVAPAVRTFAPDAIVAQLGGDSHVSDPLTHLHNTIGGHAALVARIIALADDVCGGRIAAVGGGGYQPFSVVPRMWAVALALLLGVAVPPEVPTAWTEEARAAAREAGAEFSEDPATFFDELPARSGVVEADVLAQTERAIEAARAASPLIDE